MKSNLENSLFESHVIIKPSNMDENCEIDDLLALSSPEHETCPSSSDPTIMDSLNFQKKSSVSYSRDIASSEFEPIMPYYPKEFLAENYQNEPCHTKIVEMELATQTAMPLLDSIEPNGQNLTIEPVLNSSHKKKRKRKPNPLLNFYNNPQSKIKKPKKKTLDQQRKYPKKEYYRCKLIRQCKKSIRRVIDLKPAVKFNVSNYPEKKTHIEDFNNIIINNKTILFKIAQTKEGPIVDSKIKLKKELGDEFKSKVNKAKTYNNTYCKEKLGGIFKQAFIYFVNIIFAGGDCKQLFEYFDFSCCESTIHDDTCLSRWNELKDYTCSELIPETISDTGSDYSSADYNSIFT
jgi:hypothetical protein